MKIIKPVFAFALAGAVCFLASPTAMAVMEERETVVLNYPNGKLESSQYFGTSGQGMGYNSKDSKIPVNYFFKTSTGGRWCISGYKLVASGGRWISPKYFPRSDTLYKISLMCQPSVFGGDKYWKAVGTIRTDKE